MSSFYDHAGRKVVARTEGEPVPLRDVEALQRRFIDAVAELRRIHDELQSAQWLIDYDAAEVGEPARSAGPGDVCTAAAQVTRKN